MSNDEEMKTAEEAPKEDVPPQTEEAEKGDDRKERRRDSGRKRSRSKSRDRRRRGDDERRRRSRSRDRLVRRRSKSRSKSRERRPAPPRRPSPPPRRRSPERFVERQRRERTPPEERAAREKQKELDAMDRDTRTVFAYNLPLKAAERELFEFFAKGGPLNDVKIITDKTTGRSKGFAYIEYARREDVINALALTGQPLMGQAVMVKMSEAEKNLAWEAAAAAKKQQREMEEKGLLPAGGLLQMMGMGGAVQLPGAPPLPGMPQLPGMAGLPGMLQMPGMPPLPSALAGPARLALTNLHPSITELDLRPIFEPFGALDFVSLQRDSDGGSTGIGFVQYRSLAEATKAKENLDGLDLVNYRLQIAWTTAEAPPEVSAPLPERLVNDAEDGGGMKLTAQSRAALMSKLAANAGIDMSTVPQLPQMGMPMLPQQPQQVPDALRLQQGMLGPASPIPTHCVLVKNMFDPATEEGENWVQEITDDVRDECSKYGGVLHIYVDGNSAGFVYLKFDSVQAAAAAQKALDGRWFAGRQIACDFQFTPLYNQQFAI